MGRKRKIKHPILHLLILRHLPDPPMDMTGKKSDKVCGSAGRSWQTWIFKSHGTTDATNIHGLLRKNHLRKERSKEKCPHWYTGSSSVLEDEEELAKATGKE